MPAMPPTTAAPLLRTFRRVTVVMHSSCGDALWPVCRRLEVFSVDRASAAQRMRTFSHAQLVVSTIIYWCSHASTGADFGAKQAEFFAAQRRDDIVPNRYGDALGGLYCLRALQPAYEAYRHIGPLHAANGLPSPSEFSPSYVKLGYRNA